MEVSVERLNAAKDIAVALRSKDFRTHLSQVCDGEGNHPVVVGLPSDLCRDTVDRVREAGGEAHVAVVEGSRIHFLLFACATGELPVQAGDDQDCPIHRETTLGMLTSYLRTFQRVVVCHEVSEEVTMSLVDSSGPEFAPA